MKIGEDVMKDARVTLLLGAGFSKSVCNDFPTMRELTKSVFEDPEVSQLIRALDIQLPIFEGKTVDQVNIEEWFEILEASGAYFKDPKIFDRRKLIVQIALEVISEKIREISTALEFSNEELDSFEKLICSNVNIFTTNYDLVFEMAIAKLIELKRVEIGTPYDLNVGSIEMAYMRKSQTYLSAGATDRNNYARIFKLHGSCDWFTAEAGSSEQIYADTSLINNFLSENLRSLSKNVCESMTPVLAGPTSMKSELINSKALKPLWISSYGALRNTSKLFVYGSSLHRSDGALNALLTEGLPTSVGAIVFDEKPEAPLGRLNEITTRANNSSVSGDKVNLKNFVDTVCMYL